MHGVGRHRADHTVSTRDDVHTCLICGGEIPAGGVDVQSVTRAAQDIGVSQSFEGLGSEFRSLVGDGTLAGFSIQALAVARTDPDVAQRYLRILATTLRAVHAHTGVTGDELAQFLARGVLIVHLQALGIDVTTKSSTQAIEELLDGTQGND